MKTSKRTWRLSSLAVLGIASALQGCTGIQPDRLQPADTDKTVLLRASFSYETLNQFSGIRWQWHLAPGRYAAYRQDEAGLYYLGPRQCLSQTLIEPGWGERQSNVGKTLGSHGCGIYIPKDPAKDPKVFLLVGTWQFYPEGKAPVDQQLYPDVATVDAITRTVPNATPLQAGVGGAIGGVVVGALVAAEQGNYAIHRDQPSGADLRRALSWD